jgi:hypothetical protein
VAFDPAAARGWLAAKDAAFELTGDYAPEMNIANALGQGCCVVG